MPAAAIALIVIVGLIVLGIIGYILFDSLAGGSGTGQQTVPAPPPIAEETQSPSPGESTPPTASPAEVPAFSTPSGNITCTIDAESARCAIASFGYEPPEQPADCTSDNWGSTVAANEDGAGFSCAEAPVPPNVQPLEYGESIAAHGMECTSERDGMECVSTETGRGFKIARAAVDFTS